MLNEEKGVVLMKQMPLLSKTHFYADKKGGEQKREPCADKTRLTRAKSRAAAATDRLLVAKGRLASEK